MVFVGIIVKIKSKEPVVFTQERVGLHKPSND